MIIGQFIVYLDFLWNGYSDEAMEIFIYLIQSSLVISAMYGISLFFITTKFSYLLKINGGILFLAALCSIYVTTYYDSLLLDPDIAFLDEMARYLGSSAGLFLLIFLVFEKNQSNQHHEYLLDS
ncbi:hypothetical protein CRYO30217_02278 [Parvicella tangerina]|uniref:Uncharacterized protein n=2 Tax=Parvicella tangerina TaxID=2829795 RepID=A0A916JMY6_9FLAO|nr:hypothetical protein CRYO30217_02278 [Parvicella tangerina]